LIVVDILLATFSCSFTDLQSLRKKSGGS